MKYGIPEPKYYMWLKAAPRHACSPEDQNLLKEKGFCNTFQTSEHRRPQHLGH